MNNTYSLSLMISLVDISLNGFSVCWNSRPRSQQREKVVSRGGGPNQYRELRKEDVILSLVDLRMSYLSAFHSVSNGLRIINSHSLYV